MCLSLATARPGPIADKFVDYSRYQLRLTTQPSRPENCRSEIRQSELVAIPDVPGEKMLPEVISASLNSACPEARVQQSSQSQRVAKLRPFAEGMMTSSSLS